MKASILILKLRANSRVNAVLLEVPFNSRVKFVGADACLRVRTEVAGLLQVFHSVDVHLNRFVAPCSPAVALGVLHFSGRDMQSVHLNGQLPLLSVLQAAC